MKSKLETTRWEGKDSLLDILSYQYAQTNSIKITNKGVVNQKIRVCFNTSNLQAPILKFTDDVAHGTIIGCLLGKIRTGPIQKKDYKITKCKHGFLSYKLSSVRNALSFSRFDHKSYNCETVYNDNNILTVRLLRSVVAGEEVSIKICRPN